MALRGQLDEETGDSVARWLEIDLDSPWTAAFRLTRQGEHFAVAELRIFPTGETERQGISKQEATLIADLVEDPEEPIRQRRLGSWSEDDAVVPPGGLSSTTQRKEKLEAARTQAHKEARKLEKRRARFLKAFTRLYERGKLPSPERNLGWAFSNAPPREVGPRPRRPAPERHPPEHLVAIAFLYAQETQKRGAKGARKGLVERLARYGLNEKAIARRIRAARDRGFLTETTPGRDGGNLTALGKEVASVLLAGGEANIDRALRTPQKVPRPENLEKPER